MSTYLFTGRPHSLALVASVSFVSLLALGILAASVGGDGSSTGGKSSKRQQGKGKKRPQKVFMRGLYNLGNTCFMNSTLQSLSSLEGFNEYIENCAAFIMRNERTAVDPVDAAIALQLRNTVVQLVPQTRKVPALSPRDLVNSLSKRVRWVSSRNEQDAHELFQMISSTLNATRREADTSLFDSGFLSSSLPIDTPVFSPAPTAPDHPQNRPDVADDSAETSLTNEEPPKDPKQPVSRRGSSAASFRMPPFSNPFLGMAADRIACVKCGYTAAIRHFTFDNLSLALPMARRTTVEECLSMYTEIEQLSHFKCANCTLLATLAHTEKTIRQREAELATYVDTASSSRSSSSSSSRKVQKLRSSIKALHSNRRKLENAAAGSLEDDLKGVELTSPPPGVSTKQTMLARTPRILVLHLSRLIFLPTDGSVKNPVHVTVSPLLDISPFTTTGHISKNASKPISGSEAPSGIRGSVSLDEAKRMNCLYRLCAMVFHAGTHDSGHFYTYRRVPLNGAKSDDSNTSNTSQQQQQQKRSFEDEAAQWFMISDIESKEISESTVFSAGNAYMLFYERV
ncbi:ubiquitin-specific protease ubp1 [Coemansia sp. BCRC 34490]|nr:ubiquitin-specific protease ubp1 [Coemansia sp. BCRC 34490]